MSKKPYTPPNEEAQAAIDEAVRQAVRKAWQPDVVAKGGWVHRDEGTKK